ncbi:tripartite tricarboxylate transporter substrate-binding protein, partial [Corynebacterium sp. 142RC1]|nr:tripartite tricarboxylate transporter substrate-binding protein [Corynebacterium sp. 142RC1]
MAVNPALYRAPGFDPLKSFVPVTQVNAAPLAIVVAANSPIKTMADLRAKARADGERLTYATPGNGTLSHLVGVVLEKDAGIALTHVPYRGAGPALADLMGGQVALMITSTSSVASHIQQGMVRAIAVTSPRRIGVFKT